MTKEEVLQLARECGCTEDIVAVVTHIFGFRTKELIAFANAIRNETLEKMARHFDKPDTFIYRSECAAAIREKKRD
jgi:hypothetical protein